MCATARSHRTDELTIETLSVSWRQDALFDVPIDPQFISCHGRFIMFTRMFTSLLAALFLIGFFGTVAGCNTVEGAGKDIEHGGKAIKDEANEHK